MAAPQQVRIALLPLQRIELGIYREIRQVGEERSVTLGFLVGAVQADTDQVMERLKYLNELGRVKLWKYMSAPWIEAHGKPQFRAILNSLIGKRVAYSEAPTFWMTPTDFFAIGEFVVEITPRGRLYFESLEAQAGPAETTTLPDAGGDTAVLRNLLAEGLDLSDDLKTDAPRAFQLGYQGWYTRALAVVRASVPDRLDEFERHHQRAPELELSLETYGISDFLLGLTIIRGTKPFSGKAVARSRMLQQIAILGSALGAAQEREVTLTTESEVEKAEKAQRVFVIHGRDRRLLKGAFAFLHAIGLKPIEWVHALALTGKASPYIAEVLDAAFRHAQAVVALLTPDDEARLRHDLVVDSDQPYEKTLTGQARPNVLFEAGMAFASHPNNTVLLEIGSLRPFSDIAGRHAVRMDNSTEKRQELALKLRAAGCSVDLDGVGWHSAGDLTAPPAAPSSTQVQGDGDSILAGGRSKPAGPATDEGTAGLVEKLWLELKDPAQREAIRLLLIHGTLTNQQALHLLRQKGLATNWAAAFDGISTTTNLVQRALPGRQSDEHVYGYTGPWVINPKFRDALEDLVKRDGG